MGMNKLKNRQPRAGELRSITTFMDDRTMAKKKPTNTSAKSSHGLWDDSRRGMLSVVQKAPEQIARRVGPAVRNCHGTWQKSRNYV